MCYIIVDWVVVKSLHTNSKFVSLSKHDICRCEVSVDDVLILVDIAESQNKLYQGTEGRRGGMEVMKN